MAAKWEFEENKNIPNSRSLLQKGLRVNASSQKLWLEVITHYNVKTSTTFTCMCKFMSESTK